MGASMIVFLFMMLSVQQCLAVSCRTCEGQECLKKNVDYRMCTKLSSIVPPEAYLILPQIKENVQYGCLKLEYPHGEVGSLFVVEKCIIMQDKHSVCQDIAKRIPYTSCFVQLASDSEVISQNNYANHHETQTLKVTNERFWSTGETEERFRSFETQVVQADTNSNIEEDSAILGLELSSDSSNAHRADVSTLIAITNVPLEESEDELNSFETKESYAATDGDSSKIESSGDDITTTKPSIASTDEPATTLDIFSADNQSISTSITNLPADDAEIESSAGDLSLNVQPSDESLNNNNDRELFTQDNYEVTSESNDAEDQPSSVTLSGTETELNQFESEGTVPTKKNGTVEYSTTVGSISSIEFSDSDNNYDDAHTQLEHHDLNDQWEVIAITTLQAEHELNTFWDGVSDEAPDTFRAETEANTLTSESSDESSNSYYDKHSNDIDKLSTLTTIINNLRTDHEGASSGRYISEPESSTRSAGLSVQPTDEPMDINANSCDELTTQVIIGTDDQSTTFHPVSTLTEITSFPMQTGKEPLHLNTETSDTPQIESSTFIADLQSTIIQYIDFNTNTRGSSEALTDTYATTPSSDQFNQDSDSVETSSQQSYETVTDSFKAESENTSDDNYVAVVTISQGHIGDENSGVSQDGSDIITASSNCENHLNNVITTDATKSNNQRTTPNTLETVTQKDVALNTLTSAVIMETTSLAELLDDNNIQTTVRSSSTIDGPTEQQIIDHGVHQSGSTEGNPNIVSSTDDSNSSIKTSQLTAGTSTTPLESELFTNPNDSVMVEDGNATTVPPTTLDSIGTTKENKNCTEDASGPCLTGATSTGLPPESDSINSTTDRTTVKDDDQVTTSETAEQTETPTMFESQSASSQCFLYSPILCSILFIINKIIN